MEAVLSIEIGIPSLQISMELLEEQNFFALDMINWISLTREGYGQFYQKRIVRAYGKKVKPRSFRESDYVVKNLTFTTLKKV